MTPHQQENNDDVNRYHPKQKYTGSTLMETCHAFHNKVDPEANRVYNRVEVLKTLYPNPTPSTSFLGSESDGGLEPELLADDADEKNPKHYRLYNTLATL